MAKKSKNASRKPAVAKKKSAKRASRAAAPPPRVILFDPPQIGQDVVDDVIALLDTADMALSSPEAFRADAYDTLAVRCVLASAIQMLRPLGLCRPGPRG